MNCQEVRERSSEYLDQRLASTEVSLLEEHLKICSVCRQEVEALRATISLIGSLDEIKAAPDFLNQVHRKIERGGKMRRVLSWFFEPIPIKVPIEITALILLSIGAFHLYYSSPDLSKEYGVPAPLGSLRVAKDKPKEEPSEKKPRSEESYQMAERKPMAAARPEVQPSVPKSSEVLREAPESAAGTGSPLSRGAGVPASLESFQVTRDKAEEKTLDRKGRSEESYQMAKKEAVTQPKAQAKSSVQPSRAKPAESVSEARGKVVAAAPPPNVQEVIEGDVDVYEKRVKVLLEEVGGRLLTEDRSSGLGLLLTVELPQSRQAEFLAALKEEVSTKSKVSAALGKAKEEYQQRDALAAGEKADERKVAPALESSPRIQEPTVRLQLRILPKK